MLSLPSGDNQEEGTTDTTLVKLQGITRTDFENLLRLLYPRCVNFLDEDSPFLISLYQRTSDNQTLQRHMDVCLEASPHVGNGRLI